MIKLKHKDWIERDDDFVYRGRHFRSGWDDFVKSSTDYIMGNRWRPVSSEAQVREIYTLCSNRCDILSEGKRSKLIFNPKEVTAKTDGKNVWVTTSIIDEASKSFTEKADIMIGLTTHEMAHIKFSDFSLIKEAKDNLHRSILNILEDERIEHLLTEEFPGYAHNLAMTKKYFLEEKYLISKALEKGKIGTSIMTPEEQSALELFDLFMRFVRYPTELNEETMAEHEVDIDDIKEILTPYPLDSKELFEASVKINDIISKAIKREAEKSESEEGEEESGEDGDGEGTGRGTGGGTAEDEPKSKTKKEKKAEKEKKIKEKVSEIEKTISELIGDVESDNSGEKEVESAPSVKDIMFSEEWIYDKDYKANFRMGVSDSDRYKKLLANVIGDAKRLAGSLFTRTFNESKILKGMRSGSLDESKIVEAVHGIKTVHVHHISKESKQLNIVLLIDESGSMGIQGGDKVDNSASAAILIERAFEIFPVGNLFIYGFTGDIRWEGGDHHDENCIIRYREPGMKVKHGLGSVRGRANNRDGVCMRAVARRVRTFTKEPALFFMISDGEPAASDYGGYRDTRAAVTEVTKMGFFPIQIGIGSGLSPFTQAKMFDEFIHYGSAKQMVDDLRKLIIRKAHKIFGL